jgi:hypothetical protein
MALNVRNFQQRLAKTLDTSLSDIDKRIDACYASSPLDQQLLTNLIQLRSQVTFDLMRVNRADISDAENDLGSLQALDSAVSDLKALQSDNATATDWITKATSLLDKAMALFGALTAKKSGT